MIYRYIIACVLLTVLLTGCRKEEIADPPLARAELTTRLYDALQYDRLDEALEIIGKLLSIYPDDAELGEMHDRIVITRCIRRIQPLIDSGKLAEARKIVREENKNYPAVSYFRELDEELETLVILQNRAESLAAAKTPAELETALKNIEYSIQDHPQAEQLKRDIDKRRQDLVNMRKAEAEARAKAEKEAREKAIAARRKAREEARKKAQAEARARAEAAAQAARENAEKDAAADSESKNFVGPQIPQK